MPYAHIALDNVQETRGPAVLGTARAATTGIIVLTRVDENSRLLPFRRQPSQVYSVLARWVQRRNARPGGLGCGTCQAVCLTNRSSALLRCIMVFLW
jgi:hypothetical protein